MRIRCFGTRGSLAVSGRDHLKYGGDTTCLQVCDTSETAVIVDAGTGIRRLGRELCAGPGREHHILFTHLDEVGSDVPSLDLLEAIRLPASFVSDGVNLCAGLKPIPSGSLPSPASQGAFAGGRITVFPGAKSVPKVGSGDPLQGFESAVYLANRNSELFHDRACKSVKRINTENIVAFHSIEQALDRGFKPCRACCNVDTIRKMVSEGAAFQRARAM